MEYNKKNKIWRIRPKFKAIPSKIVDFISENCKNKRFNLGIFFRCMSVILQGKTMEAYVL